MRIAYSMKEVGKKQGEMGKKQEYWREYWKYQGRQSSVALEGAGIVDFVHQHLPKGPAKVLEIGTGAGGLAEALKKKNRKMDLHGIDIHLPENRTKLTDNYAQATGEKLPFKDGSFDAAYSTFTLEYTNMEETVKELWRVLKPGAKVALILHRKNSDIGNKMEHEYNKAALQLKFRHRELAHGIADEKRLQEVESSIMSYQNTVSDNAPLITAIKRAFENPDEAKEFFEDYGFKVEHAQLYTSPPHGHWVESRMGISMVMTKTPKKGARKKKAHPPEPLETEIAPADEKENEMDYYLHGD